jgi:hypothetical protein
MGQGEDDDKLMATFHDWTDDPWPPGDAVLPTSSGLRAATGARCHCHRCLGYERDHLLRVAEQTRSEVDVRFHALICAVAQASTLRRFC